MIGWGNSESNMLETIICNLRSSIAGEWDARVMVGTEETVEVDTGQIMKYNLSFESDFAFVLRPMITQYGTHQTRLDYYVQKTLLSSSSNQ